MKRFVLGTIVFCLALSGFSQAPNAFNYQAVLRNADGTVRKYESVSILIRIVNSTGGAVYLETHNVQTNGTGLVTMVVGQGVTSQDLSNVDWSAGPYFLMSVSMERTWE